MKKPCLIIVVLTLILTRFEISSVFALEGSTKLPQPIFYQLTQTDKQSYTLSIGKPLKIKRDTFIYKLMPNGYQLKQIKEDYAVIQVTFTNNSDDTLKYIGMSCSWWDIYRTDNPQITILQPNVECYKNGPTVIKIAPKASSVVTLTILLSKPTGFKIGMVLQKYTDDKQPIYLNAIQTNNFIWSNEVRLP